MLRRLRRKHEELVDAVAELCDSLQVLKANIGSKRCSIIDSNRSNQLSMIIRFQKLRFSDEKFIGLANCPRFVKDKLR